MNEVPAAASTVGPPPGMAVRLSSNESPFGPSLAAVAAASKTLHEAHRYPDDQSVGLRAAIATADGVSVDTVAVGTGSAALLMDGIEHLCRVPARPHRPEVLAFARSFVVYRLAAERAGATYVEVPTNPGGQAGGYQRDVEQLLSAITDRTRVIAIDNPGNPTGAFLTGTQLRELAARVPDHVTVIVDEAYYHFALGQRGYQTVGQLGLDPERFLTLRTFSKAYALAGMRVGYLTGAAQIVAAFDARRTRFNVTAPAQAAAEASLADTDHLAVTIEGTLAGRDRMYEALAALPVDFTHGLGNFVTIELGRDAAQVVEDYAARGVGVRALAPYGMNEQIRVTVGTEAEVDAFIRASQEVLADTAQRA